MEPNPLRLFCDCIAKPFMYAYYLAGRVIDRADIVVHTYTRKKQIRDYCAAYVVRKLHIGCGKNILPGWLNSDVDLEDGKVFIDATARLPFHDGTVDYIFSEHFIEHLSYDDGMRFLKECYRVLRPGGRVRIATPDLQFLVDLYSDHLADLQKSYIHSVNKKLVPHIDGSLRNSSVFTINNFFFKLCHNFIYDFALLRDTMTFVGYRDITRYAPGESADINLQGIEKHGQAISDEFNDLETFVVEGIKPSET